MQIQGRITKLLPPSDITSKAGNTYKKQQFVLTYKKDEQHPKAIVIEAFGAPEKIAEFGLTEGVAYTADIDFEVREWNGRYFNDIRLNSITPLQTAQAPQPKPAPQPVHPVLQGVAQQAQQQSTTPAFDPFATTDDDDNLPF